MSVSRIYRLLRIVTMLQEGRGYMADDLAQELEVSRRMVFRDLNMLEMARIPYYFDADRGSYRANRHFFLPVIDPTLTEALAILLPAGRLKGTSKLPLLSQAAKAAAKDESALPIAIREQAGSMTNHLSVSLGPVLCHDGSAEFHVRVDGLGEITWWILGYGDQVEVISPPLLRRRVADIAAATLQRYSQGGPQA